MIAVLDQLSYKLAAKHINLRDSSVRILRILLYEEILRTLTMTRDHVVGLCTQIDLFCCHVLKLRWNGIFSLHL